VVRRRLAAPGQALAEEVKRRDADALEPVDESGLPAEVSPLIEAINALLARACAVRSMRNARSSRMPRTSCALR